MGGPSHVLKRKGLMKWILFCCHVDFSNFDSVQQRLFVCFHISWYASFSMACCPGIIRGVPVACSAWTRNSSLAQCSADLLHGWCRSLLHSGFGRLQTPGVTHRILICHKFIYFFYLSDFLHLTTGDSAKCPVWPGNFYSIYWLYHDSHAYANVLPSEPAAGYLDAGKLVFAEEAHIDARRGMGFKDRDVEIEIYWNTVNWYKEWYENWSNNNLFWFLADHFRMYLRMNETGDILHGET